MSTPSMLDNMVVKLATCPKHGHFLLQLQSGKITGGQFPMGRVFFKGIGAMGGYIRSM